jgi:hypothetical protein
MKGMSLYSQSIIPRIHAGDNEINCICHSARVSKHSGIPSLNVCMNCHKNIRLK